MFDSHTHLVSDELYNDLDFFLQNFSERGGIGLLNVGYNFDSIFRALEIAQKYSHSQIPQIYTTIGLHPDLFSKSSRDPNKIDNMEALNAALRKFEQIFNENLTRLTAIGETGLDYHAILHDETLSFEEKERSKEMQKISFRKHLELSAKHNLPLTIHTRDNQNEDFTITDTIKCVCESEIGKLRGCFHSYTGQIEYVEEILDLGFYIGVNGICTYPKAENVREIVRKTPLEKILLETDAPYLPPQSIRNNKKLSYRMGQPSDIFEIAKVVGEIKGISQEKILKQNEENFKELFL